MLKKQTGISAKEHINNFIVEKAKIILLSESGSVSETAYSLGFNYPHYFSRMFKAKTGKTPQEYRQHE
ncbi:MAG: helix-turn-helix domain-containing protein [Cruoricaptor ignavus]|nr:helix-turn-helix domain-containing protein [Cruoricaptor ignavus]